MIVYYRYKQKVKVCVKCDKRIIPLKDKTFKIQNGFIHEDCFLEYAKSKLVKKEGFINKEGYLVNE